MREITRFLKGPLQTSFVNWKVTVLITRTVYAEVLPRVEYSITPKGKSLEHILELM